ncbi:MAG: hypothetical protein SP1CHLAM54_05330 [Chlamydiia bacterium]|nr:hypothetical protein [Chlamydiia bacterium]MCH9615445.1 hypothetical protein [Chlamydiia bacterium]MCH9628233.1 hypothetical protein [Chlamydiia bacterium]
MIRNQHISFSHELWKKHLNPNDLAIDATCGNGKDAFILAKLPISLICLDIQQAAIETSKKYLNRSPNVTFYHQSHETFPPLPKPPRLIIYNLGYLPGGDKELTTKTFSTIQSLKNALSILASDGLISIMCYPGHPEGAHEAQAVKAFISPFPHTVHTFYTRSTSPFLITLRSLK